MAKLLLLTFAVLTVATYTVSAGKACSKGGASCSIGAGKIECCMGYVCSAKDLKCEGYVGRVDSEGSPGYDRRPSSQSVNRRPPSRSGSSGSMLPSTKRPTASSSRRSSG